MNRKHDAFYVYYCWVNGGFGILELNYDQFIWPTSNIE